MCKPQYKRVKDTVGYHQGVVVKLVKQQGLRFNFFLFSS
jgi:hypothetical protein